MGQEKATCRPQGNPLKMQVQMYGAENELSTWKLRLEDQLVAFFARWLVIFSHYHLNMLLASRSVSWLVIVCVRAQATTTYCSNKETNLFSPMRGPKVHTEKLTDLPVQPRTNLPSTITLISPRMNGLERSPMVNCRVYLHTP